MIGSTVGAAARGMATGGEGGVIGVWRPAVATAATTPSAITTALTPTSSPVRRRGARREGIR